VKHLGLKPVRQLEPALREICQRYRESAHRTRGVYHVRCTSRVPRRWGYWLQQWQPSRGSDDNRCGRLTRGKTSADGGVS